MKAFFFCCFSLMLFKAILGQNHVEPPYWWVGMENKRLQLVLEGPEIGSYQAKMIDASINILAQTSGDHPDYLFLDLDLKHAKAGVFNIQLSNTQGQTRHIRYELKRRLQPKEAFKGFDSSDVVYLLTPDRFSNGDPNNDQIEGYLDHMNRDRSQRRHGGDIQGIIQHLDYIEDMGFTQIWSMPMDENNNPQSSYHGYATTDYYKVDPRFGSLDDYRRLSKEARKRGIGIIKDMIPNHIGGHHRWLDKTPFKDWFNNRRENFSRTDHNRIAILDPNASESDRAQFSKSSFVISMPDLNQTNPFLSTYLIQNAIWWIETAQLSGLRVDTYSYSDKGFLKDWVDAIMKEYPNFNIVGEEWIYNPAVIAYWMKGQVNHDGYQSSLPSLMDFPLQGAMQSSFSPEGSLLPIYEALQMDFVYPNPHNLLTFMDNHDMDRFAGHIQEDLDTFKVALTLLMTTRGIPQFFYGTEILKNHERKGHHPSLRSDMPGGWPGDPSSVFTGVGLSEKERNSLSFVKQLLQWRKHEPLVHHGQLLHYKPQDGVYVYFRIIKDQARRLMVMLNPYEQSNLVPLKRFSQGLGSATKATHALSRTSFKWQDQIQLSPKSALILEIE